MKCSLIVLVVLILSSCSIKPEEWKNAEELCKNNKGIKYVVVDNLVGNTIRCKNEAEFRM